MYPDPLVVKSQVGSYEESGTRALGIGAILQTREREAKEKGRERKERSEGLVYHHRILHVSHGTVKFPEVELRAVRKREVEVTAGPAGLKYRLLTVLAIAQYSCMVLACRDTLRT